MSPHDSSAMMTSAEIFSSNAFEPPHCFTTRGVRTTIEVRKKVKKKAIHHILALCSAVKYGKRMLRQKIERPGTTKSYEQR